MLTKAEINSYRRRLLALKSTLAPSLGAGRGGPANRRSESAGNLSMCRSIRRTWVPRTTRRRPRSSSWKMRSTS